jgi:hypothetical protein
MDHSSGEPVRCAAGPVKTAVNGVAERSLRNNLAICDDRIKPAADQIVRRG